MPENRMPTKVKSEANERTFAALNWKKLYLNMEKTDWKTMLKRFGVAGFLFFLVKGLVWLAVFFGAGKLLCS